jgi:hypothetical protein
MFDQHGRPMMYVYDNCQAFIRTVPLMVYDEHRPEDLDTEMEDHVCDEWRYMCMSRPVKPIRSIPKRQILSDPLNMFHKER